MNPTIATWRYSPDWEINNKGMVGQSLDELRSNSLPIFTELAAERNDQVCEQQKAAGIPVTHKWTPTP